VSAFDARGVYGERDSLQFLGARPGSTSESTREITGGTTMTSVPSTRKRLREGTPEPTTETMLQAVLQEIRQMREAYARKEEQLETAIRQRDEEIQLLRAATATTQLSPTINNGARESVCAGAGVASAWGDVRAETMLKLKPDTYDGSVPWREFLSQFEIIASANRWNNVSKTLALASVLRGKARSVLESVQNHGELNFDELKSKLELRFGEGHLPQNYYSLLSSRRQRIGEDYASFGAELERLARLAYPEFPFEARDKIACAQFISGLPDSFVKRTLQVEGVASLNLAIQRAKVLKNIQGENNAQVSRNSWRFSREAKRFPEKDKEEESESEKKKGGGGGDKGESSQKGKFRVSPKECWTCGKKGHFRFQCPENRN